MGTVIGRSKVGRGDPCTAHGLPPRLAAALHSCWSRSGSAGRLPAAGASGDTRRPSCCSWPSRRPSASSPSPPSASPSSARVSGSRRWRCAGGLKRSLLGSPCSSLARRRGRPPARHDAPDRLARSAPGAATSTSSLALPGRHGGPRVSARPSEWVLSEGHDASNHLGAGAPPHAPGDAAFPATRAPGGLRGPTSRTPRTHLRAPPSMRRTPGPDGPRQLPFLPFRVRRADRDARGRPRSGRNSMRRSSWACRRRCAATRRSFDGATASPRARHWHSRCSVRAQLMLPVHSRVTRLRESATCCPVSCRPGSRAPVCRRETPGLARRGAGRPRAEPEDLPAGEGRRPAPSGAGVIAASWPVGRAGGWHQVTTASAIVACLCDRVPSAGSILAWALRRRTRASALPVGTSRTRRTLGHCPLAGDRCALRLRSWLCTQPGRRSTASWHSASTWRPT